MKPTPFAARVLRYCELREARTVIKREMAEDPCEEQLETMFDKVRIGDPVRLPCYLEVWGDGDRMPVEERCEACQRNAARYEKVGRLSAKIGGALNAMMNAWRREYK
jgi:hypothetical protein